MSHANITLKISLITYKSYHKFYEKENLETADEYKDIFAARSRTLVPSRSQAMFNGRRFQRAKCKHTAVVLLLDSSATDMNNHSYVCLNDITPQAMRSIHKKQ